MLCIEYSGAHNPIEIVAKSKVFLEIISSLTFINKKLVKMLLFLVSATKSRLFLKEKKTERHDLHDIDELSRYCEFFKTVQEMHLTARKYQKCKCECTSRFFRLCARVHALENGYFIGLTGNH